MSWRRFVGAVAAVVLAACGGVAESADPSPCAAVAVSADSGSAPDATDGGVVAEECLETDHSIVACLRAAGPYLSWTAPETCTAGNPQKQGTGGHAIDRPAGRACCVFLSGDEGTALCCADKC
jgi:hypothetical protein